MDCSSAKVANIVILEFTKILPVSRPNKATEQTFARTQWLGPALSVEHRDQ